MPGAFYIVIGLGLIFALRQLGRMQRPQAVGLARRAIPVLLLIAAGFMVVHGNAIMSAPIVMIAGLMWQFSSASKRQPRSSPAAATDPGQQEALEILGLKSGATTEEIKAAHKRLVRSAHPDAGGSAWLSARINAARDRLLRS